ARTGLHLAACAGVPAGAEVRALSPHRHQADTLRAGDLLADVSQLTEHAAVDAVALVRAGQRDAREAAVELEPEGLVIHAASVAKRTGRVGSGFGICV